MGYWINRLNTEAENGDDRSPLPNFWGSCRRKPVKTADINDLYAAGHVIVAQHLLNGADGRLTPGDTALTQEKRDAWHAAAAKLQSSPRLGQSGPLTAQQHIVGVNALKERWGLPLLLEPPVGKSTLQCGLGRFSALRWYDPCTETGSAGPIPAV